MRPSMMIMAASETGARPVPSISVKCSSTVVSAIAAGKNPARNMPARQANVGLRMLASDCSTGCGRQWFDLTLCYRPPAFHRGCERDGGPGGCGRGDPLIVLEGEAALKVRLELRRAAANVP